MIRRRVVTPRRLVSPQRRYQAFDPRADGAGGFEEVVVEHGFDRQPDEAGAGEVEDGCGAILPVDEVVEAGDAFDAGGRSEGGEVGAGDRARSSLTASYFVHSVVEQD